MHIARDREQPAVITQQYKNGDNNNTTDKQTASNTTSIE